MDRKDSMILTSKANVFNGSKTEEGISGVLLVTTTNYLFLVNRISSMNTYLQI